VRQSGRLSRNALRQARGVRWKKITALHVRSAAWKAIYNREMYCCGSSTESTIFCLVSAPSVRSEKNRDGTMSALRGRGR